MFSAFCEDGCRSGGTCVSPNTCVCPSGFTGARCETGKLKILTSCSARVWISFSFLIFLLRPLFFCLLVFSFPLYIHVYPNNQPSLQSNMPLHLKKLRFPVIMPTRNFRMDFKKENYFKSVFKASTSSSGSF